MTKVELIEKIRERRDFGSRGEYFEDYALDEEEALALLEEYEEPLRKVLRDSFAEQALAGMSTALMSVAPEEIDFAAIAMVAYRVADAMLDQRRRRFS